MGEVAMKAVLFIIALLLTASEPTGSGLLHFFMIIALWASFVWLCVKSKVSNRANFYKPANKEVI
jgi:uncharacterized membrane-anchored protein